jgi:hypothetical protein
MRIRTRLASAALSAGLLLSMAAAPTFASTPHQNGLSWFCSYFSNWQNQFQTFAAPYMTARSATFLNGLWFQFCQPT